MIKQVQSFKTSDGTLHSSRLDALLSEQRIEIRGVIQSGPNGIPLKNGSLTVPEAVQICIENSTKIAAIVSKYNRSIRHERSKGANAQVAKA